MHRKLILRHRAGITLIELMITLAIIGTLTAILAAGVMDHLRRADVKATELIIAKTGSALLLYRAENRRYPTDWSEALTYLPDRITPKDAWGNPLAYQAPASDGEAPFEITSWGQDGAPGGEGFDADISSLHIQP